MDTSRVRTGSTSTIATLHEPVLNPNSTLLRKSTPLPSLFDSLGVRGLTQTYSSQPQTLNEAFASYFYSSEHLPTQKCAIICTGGSFRRAKSGWESLRNYELICSGTHNKDGSRLPTARLMHLLHQLRERTLKKTKDICFFTHL